MKYISYGMSHPGLVRSKNEDAFFVDDDLGLYIVADGVGGLTHGEVASDMTVSLIVEYIRNMPVGHLPDWSQCLNDVNEAVNKKSQAMGVFAGMGSTVTLAYIQGQTISFAHVGDTSLLLFRPKEAPYILTTDHTIGQEILQASTNPEEIYIPEIYMHSLTRCIGQPDPLMVDTGVVTIHPNDRLLLISDGVLLGAELDDLYHCAFVSDQPKDYVQHLIEKANLAGGFDNSTAIAIFFSD